MSKIIFSDMHAEYHPPKPSYEVLKQENEQLKAGFMPQLEEAIKDKNYYRDAAEHINKINMENSEIAFNLQRENEQQSKRIRELEEALKEVCASSMTSDINRLHKAVVKAEQLLGR